jgi:hypothetical protein
VLEIVLDLVLVPRVSVYYEPAKHSILALVTR